MRDQRCGSWFSDRFQAAAVGDRIFIHCHKSVDDIYVIDTGTNTLSKLQVWSYHITVHHTGYMFCQCDLTYAMI